MGKLPNAHSRKLLRVKALCKAGYRRDTPHHSLLKTSRINFEWRDGITKFFEYQDQGQWKEQPNEKQVLGRVTAFGGVNLERLPTSDKRLSI